MKKEKRKKSNKKCWQCKRTIWIYSKDAFGDYSERCSKKCGPELLGKQLQFF